MRTPEERIARRMRALDAQPAFQKAAQTRLKELHDKKTPTMDFSIIPALVQYGGYHFEKGLRTFEAWAERMLADIGEGVRDYLHPTFDMIETHYRKAPPAAAAPVADVILDPDPTHDTYRPGTVLPHPALLEIAEINGDLKPALRDYEDQLPLEPETLVPQWFPHETEDGEPMSPDERRSSFVTMFQAIRKSRMDAASKTSANSPNAPASDLAMPTGLSSTQQIVLSSLLQLRSAVVQDIARAKD